MKQLAQRTMLLIGLGIFAIGWTFLMGLGVRSAVTTGDSAAMDQAGPQVTYLDDSQFPTVTAYLVVNDESGQPIFNLQKDNFSLTEDGAPVAITDFSAAGNQAATVMLVLDRSGSMDDEDKFEGAQQAAISFIEQMQPGQDQVGLIAFDDVIDVVEPLALLTDAGQQALIAKIQNLNAHDGTEFYRAVQEAMTQLRDASGRKVILALTDGLDNNERRWLDSTSQATVDENVSVYTIGLGNELDEVALQRLAGANGGAYHHSPDADELEQLYLDIGGDLRNEYAVTFESATGNLDGTRRSLEVTITTDDGEIQAGGVYAVAGVLAASFNPVLFVPLFLGLLIGLVALYKLPTLRRRMAASLDEPLALGVISMPSPAPPVAPQPPAAMPAAATVAIAGMAYGGGFASGTPATPTRVVAAAPPAYTVANSGAALVEQLAFPTADVTIGSAPNAQLPVTHPSVRSQHARISLQGDRYVIDDLSGGQTLVSFNGDPTQLRAVQRNALRDGSLVQLGEQRFTFRQALGQAPVLERRYALGGAGLMIGADPSCQVVVAGAPRQARLLQEGARWVVEDLAGGVQVSFSGDRAQERPVTGRNALKSGSTLRIGATLLRLDVG